MPKESDEAVVPKVAGRTDTATKVFCRYHERHREIFSLFGFTLELIRYADEGRRRAAEALAIDGSEQDKARLKEVINNPEPALQKYKESLQINSEFIVILLVDNFLIFLSELIQSAMNKRPEMLASSDKITFEDVVKLRK